MTAPRTATTPESRFRAAYAEHRAREGRAHDRAELTTLPYLRSGPLAKQWTVKAKTFEAFVRHVLRPALTTRGQSLSILDLGAGNAWLCRHAALAGCRAIAVDVRTDDVDGLGAAGAIARDPGAGFDRIAASFDRLPLREGEVDIVVFNASLHYALDLRRVLCEAVRATRAGGCIVILDSPFYANEAAGRAMVAEKHEGLRRRAGEQANDLLSLPFIEYLTCDRLREASHSIGLDWCRHRVRYPLWYELRPVIARLRRARVPSRFDLWEARVP